MGKVIKELYDKDGIKYVYPSRTCKECIKYPCFIGIEKRVCDFAKYGCRDFKQAT